MSDTDFITGPISRLLCTWTVIEKYVKIVWSPHSVRNCHQLAVIPWSRSCMMPPFKNTSTLTNGVDWRTGTGDCQEPGLTGHTQDFIRGAHQPASVMQLLRLIWNCHWIAVFGRTSGWQFGGTGGTLSRQWCWAGCRLPAGTAFLLFVRKGNLGALPEITWIFALFSQMSTSDPLILTVIA